MTATAMTVAMLSVTFLTACTSDLPTYAIFERPAEASDALPADLPQDALDTLSPETARLAGEDAGSELYLVRSSDLTQTCLLAYATAEDWLLGCSEGDSFKVGMSPISYEVRADGMPAPKEKTKLTTNVYKP
ncbi:hypothetical protein [Agromyces ramosus]|uniref:Lipoprotein n=1 Tax=Agromyces ramosus TaxID=33879 RepID=A0ABU0R9W8_9MICO|nr:hypothetical protein [Agromyces ramosus]MDQ0894848.1 hypothetical protein [Agromyces ramosus]